MDSDSLFLATREAINRGAFARHIREKGASDEKTITAAASAFRALRPLQQPGLEIYTRNVLAGARGPTAGGSTPFPATLWLGGATDTRDGRHFTGTIEQFVHLLEERATKLAPKRTGWIIEPTTNTDGWRGNASTVAMHALFLDCDGTGSWDHLLATLDELDFCYVTYQSGGWTTAEPKWRVVLPLAAPHDTRTEAGQNAWKTLYNHARVLFGACAQLANVGFDPATDTPCCPWFLTERREETDPARVVRWRAGATLDLVALTLQLPEVSDEKVIHTESSYVPSQLTLDEDRLNVIIDALSTATNKVPTGRRDLYLALPGALLDRGVPPNDVLAIVEAVSSNYPRKHADKHADNMHNARTTIAKYEAREQYTRIGTLNSTAPLVAAALDLVLPDQSVQFIVDSVEKMLHPDVSTDESPTVNTVTSQNLPRRRMRMSALGRELSPAIARLKTSSKPLNKLGGVLLGCFLDGVPLPTSPVTTPSEVDELVCTAMRALGRHALATTRWQEALDFAGRSLLLMGFSQSLERVSLAERAFYEGQGSRHRSNLKKAALAAEFKNQSAQFLKSAAKGKG